MPIPLLQGWADWLWKRGIENGEIEALEGYRLSAYECRVDPDLLKDDLSRAIRKKQLKLLVPKIEPSSHLRFEVKERPHETKR